MQILKDSIPQSGTSRTLSQSSQKVPASIRYSFYKNSGASFWQPQTNPGGHSRNPFQSRAGFWNWNSHQYPKNTPSTAQLPGSCSPPLGGVWLSSKAPNFLSWLSYTLQVTPADTHGSHGSAANTTRKGPARNESRLSLAAALSKSCYPAGTSSFWQIHYVSNPFMSIKSSKGRPAGHKAAGKLWVLLLTCRSEFSRSASSVFSSWAFSFIKSLLWFWLFWRLCFSWLISFSSSSSWEEKQKF